MVETLVDKIRAWAQNRINKTLPELQYGAQTPETAQVAPQISSTPPSLRIEPTAQPATAKPNLQVQRPEESPVRKTVHAERFLQ